MSGCSSSTACEAAGPESRVQVAAPALSEAPPVAQPTLADELQAVLQAPEEMNDAGARLLDAALYGPLRGFLARPSKGLRARLVELGYQLAQGQQSLPREVPLLVECLHAGSLIVDDIQDGSAWRRGQPTMHRQHGLPVALNAGNFLYFLPQQLLGRLSLAPEIRLRMLEDINHCLLRCHQGQALDLTVRLGQLSADELWSQAWQNSRLKTGALLGLGIALGAHMAGASPELLAALREFGEQVGIGLQMLDDLSGVLNPARRHKGLEDLAQGRVTWALACLQGRWGELGLGAYQAPETLGPERLQHALEALKLPLSVHGPQCVRAHMKQALEQLTAHVDAQSCLQELEPLLHDMERRFLEGS